jgi:predicted regulator of Ras-like GTPase activity (Roadblock/LC7/MglB family)
MSLTGNLRDMSVADLIQHNCTDQKKAQLTISHSGREAVLYFDAGNVAHASLDELEGEEVVYEILAWDDGTFSLSADIESPKTSINRSWSGLLMEGARRLDEQNVSSDFVTTNQNENLEEPLMAQRLDEILEEMSTEVNGFDAGAVTGMDGITVAQVTKSKINPEAVDAQLTIFIKLIVSSAEKSGTGLMEDVLIQTDKYYIMNALLPGDSNHFLTTIVERKTGSLGNMRLVSKIFAERLSKVMPR